MGQGSAVWGWRASRAPLRAWAFVLLAALPACSDYKKLSGGGSITDVVIYDVLGQDRAPSYYYQLVRNSHKESDFCYRCGSDPFLVDKNVDALQRLGRAEYGRLEGEAEVVELFTEVLLEDCSALARSSAAGSLTLIGTKLPAYPGPRVEDRGDKFLAYAQELDRLYRWQPPKPQPAPAPGCPPRPPPARPRCPPTNKPRVVQLLDAIGNLAITDPVVTRDSLKFFYGRSYLIDETDPQIRQAADTALVKRLRSLISDSLQAAVEDSVGSVRVDAVKGLKTMADRAAVEAVIHRLAVEPEWLVRLEIAEYFGKVGTREGVIALVAMLDDPNASVRHKAHTSLTCVAGQDYGRKPGNWKFWARQLDPEIDFGDEDSEYPETGMDASGPLTGP